jgi:hypothetical protein
MNRFFHSFAIEDDKVMQAIAQYGVLEADEAGRRRNRFTGRSTALPWMFLNAYA